MSLSGLGPADQVLDGRVRNVDGRRHPPADGPVCDHFGGVPVAEAAATRERATLEDLARAKGLAPRSSCMRGSISAKRGRRKLVLTRTGRLGAARRVDNAMVKALTRAFRWRKTLDEGVHATLEGYSQQRRNWMICWMGFRWSGRGNSASSAGSRIDRNDSGKRTSLARRQESALRQVRPKWWTAKDGS